MKKNRFLDYVNISVFVLLLNFQFFLFNQVFQILLIWIATLIIIFKSQLLKNIANNKKLIFISVIWFLPLLISLIYSSDIPNALNQIKKVALVFVFPVIILMVPQSYSKKLFKLSCIIFPISTLLFVIYIVTRLLFFWYDNYVIQYGEPNSILQYIHFVYNHRFSYLLESSDIQIVSQFVHKAYLGINILISIVLLEFWKTKYLKLLLQLLLLVTLVVFKAKAQIIVGILLGAYIAYNLLKKQKSILALAIIILGFVAVLNFNKVYGKIKNLTLSSRVEIAKCSYEISKESFLFGIGVGDVKNRLNECYLQKECNDCTNLNSHNYYMNILLSSGVLGLALFIFSYAKIILYSKGTNKELLMILLIILFSMLFENIYSRMWGCLSGGLFINLLLSQKLINKNESFISTKIQ